MNESAQALLWIDDPGMGPNGLQPEAASVSLFSEERATDGLQAV